MRSSLRFVSLVAGVFLGIAGSGMASASVADSDWSFQLKVRGAAAKVGSIKADGGYELAFGAGDFSLSPNGAPSVDVSGTYVDQAGKLLFTPNSAQLGSYAQALIEDAAEGRGKVAAVTSVTITKFSSKGSSEKQTWPAQTLTFSWKVNFTFSGVVDGKTLTNAKGSLTITGKATDTERGTAATLAGSTWNLNMKVSISASGAGSDSWTDVGTMVFGPAIGLDANEFRAGPLAGTYTVTSKGIGMVFDDSNVTSFLEDEVALFMEDTGASVSWVDIESVRQKNTATFSGEGMTFSITLSFSGTAEVNGDVNQGHGTFKIRGTGTRL